MSIYSMKQKLFILLFFVNFYAQAQIDYSNVVRTTLQLFSSQKFDSLSGMMAPQIKKYMNEDRLDMTWNDMIDKYDSLVKINETSITFKDSITITETKIEFVKKSFNYKVTFNSKQQIIGMYFLNTQVQHTPPDYINALNFVEYKIAVPTKGIKAEGVLSMPRRVKQAPLVIIVGGSGPTDKDGTVGPNKPYLDIAWGLAQQGIAAYRYDKRIVNRANIQSDKLNEMTIDDEYVDDIKNIIKYFKQDKRIDAKQIFILGHSQGGYIIPYLAKNIKSIKGFIGMAAGYSSLLEVIPNQVDYLMGLNPNDNSSKAAYLKMKNQIVYTRNHLYDKNINMDSVFQGVGIKYLQHMEANSPAKLARYIKHKPLLLIQGERDYQVPTTELEQWKRITDSTSTKVILYPKLNHLMMEGEGLSTPAEYAKPNNVPYDVADAIKKWIENLPR